MKKRTELNVIPNTFVHISVHRGESIPRVEYTEEEIGTW